MRRLIRFARLERQHQRLLLSAAFQLGAARLLLLVMPFRRLAQRLGSDQPATHADIDPDYIRHVSRAVTTAARHVPWRADCFPQAIAALKLLQRRSMPATLHIGVTKDESGELAGHAWLSCAAHVVTGGPDIARYTELHRIPPEPAAPAGTTEP